jgi:hypothetical protein
MPEFDRDVSLQNVFRNTNGQSAKASAHDENGFDNGNQGLSPYLIDQRLYIMQLFPAKWTLTAKLIRNCKGAAGPDASRFDDAWATFNDRDHRAMKHFQISKQSLEQWATLLLEPSIDAAVAKLQDMIFPKLGQNDPAQLPPLFVILFLLKRHDLPPHALQALLACTWAIMRFQGPSMVHEDVQVFMVFMRFARWSAQVWPQGILNVAALLTTFVPTRLSMDEPLSDESYAHLTTMFNGGLRMVARYARNHPYGTAHLQEQAQVMIISKMIRFNPPLRITGTGYKSLVGVQLRRPKTEQEQAWADLKSRSWPPWPKPRTAMDEDKGYEYGTSRSIKTLQLMRRAGYAYPEWERIARVYGGWDADGTPTIQTRFPYLKHTFLPQNVGAQEARYWAAKVQTTRDVREAWAMFLQHEATQTPRSFSLYRAMFDKIVQERKRTGDATYDVRTTNSLAMAGEMAEVSSPATSPKERIFIQSEPPTFMELFGMVAQDDIRITPSFLNYLISHAPSIKDAIEIWEVVTGDVGAQSLVPTAIKYSLDREAKNGVRNLLPALVAVLCRFPWDSSATALFSKEQLAAMANDFSAVFQLHESSDIRNLHVETRAVMQAGYLCKAGKPMREDVWRSLLVAIRRARPASSDQRAPVGFLFFGVVLDILSSMNRLAVVQTMEFFDALCIYMEYAGRAALQVIHSPETRRLADATPFAEAFVASGSMVLRKLFAVISGPPTNPDIWNKSMDGLHVPPIPTLSDIPTSLQCHHYVRTLGLFQDFEGLYSLAKWIEMHEEELHEFNKVSHGGQRRWTQVRAAFRLAFEDPSKMYPSRMFRASPGWKQAPPELLKLVEATFNRLKLLGGWARIDETEDYELHMKMGLEMAHHQMHVLDNSQRTGLWP